MYIPVLTLKKKNGVPGNGGSLGREDGGQMMFGIGVIMIMPFGKYKGRSVYSIPRDYLAWLRDECRLYGRLARAVDDALGQDSFEQDDIIPPDSFDGDALKTIYRKLALKWHPDHGGSTEAMQALNDFYDELQSLK